MTHRASIIVLLAVAVSFVGCGNDKKAGTGKKEGAGKKADAGKKEGAGKKADDGKKADTGPYPDCSSGELPYDLPAQTQAGADSFAWSTFLALSSGETPAWSNWPTTVDLIDCNQDAPPQGGKCSNGRFVPTACEGLYSDGMMILDEVGKVDDDILEATTKGLSADPVLASNGTFLRYIIVSSPETAQWIKKAGLQKESTLDKLTSPVDFPCSSASDPGSNKQSTLLKLAWMDPKGAPAGATYYEQEVLVYSPAYRLQGSSEDSCVKQKMALVGVHVLRKTETQLGWVWGTFEHDKNAPDCTQDMPASGPNTSCPKTESSDWNFYSSKCQEDGTDGVCKSCNVVPANNAEGCVNPDAPSTGSWCLDQPPNAKFGLSRLCRQVKPDEYYAGATGWDDTPPNKACQPKEGVWSNYQLISTQWSVKSLGTGCVNAQSQIFDGKNVIHANIGPSVDLAGKGPRPILGNTSMESYERANCEGCHSKSSVNESGSVSTTGTDFVYFLGLEVPGVETTSVERKKKG